MGGTGSGILALRKIMSDHVDSYRSDLYWQALTRAIAELTEKEIQILSEENVNPLDVNHISVPVFSPTGDVILELTLRGTPPDTSHSKLLSIANQLVEAANDVTTRTFGRKPQSTTE